MLTRAVNINTQYAIIATSLCLILTPVLRVPEPTPVPLTAATPNHSSTEHSSVQVWTPKGEDLLCHLVL
jgi:hypothetical protein